MSQIDLQWFAAEDEGRTEDPTEHKLNEARKEGRLPKSQELNGAIILFLCVVLLAALAPWLLKNFKEVFIFFFQNVTSPHVDDRRFAFAFGKYFVSMVAPFAAIGVIGGIVGNIAQNRGFIFSLKPIQPNFSKIVPHFIKYLKNTIFSKKGLFNIAKSLLKVAILVTIAFVLIRNDLTTTLTFLQTGGPELALRQVGSMVLKLLLIASVFLVAVGIVDFIMQKRSFKEEMKMTKQEVKEEFKQLEGDPQVKGKLKSAQQEMLKQNMPKAVREADVLITNPTHYAVALQWKRDVDYAPVVTAKGEDETALNMKRIAREADVPTVENRPLARSLYAETEIGDIIPEAYLRAIADVYAHIGFMEKEARKEAEKNQSEQLEENAS